MRGSADQVGPLGDRGVSVRPGAALLECVLALALFVSCGMAVLALVDHAVDSVATTRDAEEAADIARSAMARIEAGLVTPDTLNGPVKWGDQSDPAELSPGTAWTLEVSTEPSQFEGLTKVHVKAYKQGAGDTELASFTLHQLVRLTEQSDAGPSGERKPAGRKS